MVKKTVEKSLAEIISWVLNPALLAIAIVIIGVYKSPMEFNVKVSWIVSVIALNGAIPLFFYVYFLNKGYIFDGPLAEKSISKNRVIILMILLFLIALQILVLISTKIYQPLLVILTGGLIAVACVLLITNVWKISLHAGMTTIFAAMIIYLFGLEKTWPIILLIPLVFWARLVLVRHNFWQLIGGVALAILVVLTTFFIFRVV